MTQFIRARSEEQKEMRMQDIKKVADRLFLSQTYHEITLASIAEHLSWSRANLYKYVTSKEEIFLELCEDKRNAYFEALKAAFPINCAYSMEVIASVWTEILIAHQDYLQYSSILTAILETNVSVEKLANFKKKFHEDFTALTELFACNFRITLEQSAQLFYAVHAYSVMMYSNCITSPKVQEACALAGLETRPRDFRGLMKNYLTMCLGFYLPKSLAE